MAVAIRWAFMSIIVATITTALMDVRYSILLFIGAYSINMIALFGISYYRFLRHTKRMEKEAKKLEQEEVIS